MRMLQLLSHTMLGILASANGCGAHIHSGTSCADSASQGGHFYDSEIVAIDPWINEGYTTTTRSGQAYYVGCVVTGEDSFKGKPFIVHEEDGSRAACGLLEPCESFRQCESFFGAGLWMTRGTVPVSFTGQIRCRSSCIPSWLIGLARFFGFSCGRCVDSY